MYHLFIYFLLFHYVLLILTDFEPSGGWVGVKPDEVTVRFPGLLHTEEELELKISLLYGSYGYTPEQQPHNRTKRQAGR